MAKFSLIPHPVSQPVGVRDLQVEIAVLPNQDLGLTYTLNFEPGQVRIPSSGPNCRADGLWRHTCFELFAAGEGPAYREFNFSPCGKWQVYDFHGYRAGGKMPRVPAPAMSRSDTKGRIQLRIGIPRSGLPHASGLCLGLSAVVEAADDIMSYWALSHPGSEPDFHRIESFIFELS